MSNADKKLEKMGFVKNKSECYSEEKGVLIYEKPVMSTRIKEPTCVDIFSITFRDKKVCVCDLGDAAIKTDKELLNAIVEKMEEMGW